MMRKFLFRLLFHTIPMLLEEVHSRTVYVGHKMKFLAFESLRISLKLNISAARERQAVGLGPLL